jgi:GNAT superfamily N-acetyltransferase
MSLLVGPLVVAADAYEIFRACEVHDKPDVPVISRDNFVARLAHPWPGSAHEHYLAYVDGVPVGYVDMEMPNLDNLGDVQIELSVLPAYRRRGAGRALIDMVVERARAAGRKSVIGRVLSRHPDGSKFAAAMDAKPGLEEVRSRLELHTIDQARLDGRYAEAWRHAAGYRLTHWTGCRPRRSSPTSRTWTASWTSRRGNRPGPTSRRFARASCARPGAGGSATTPASCTARGWSPGRRSPATWPTRRTPGRTSRLSPPSTAAAGWARS